ncbi:MAG: dihydroorotate dehydrogenase electron transfer subunit [Candidatus Dormibacteria bacterium]
MSARLERGMVTQREEVMPGTWLLRLRSPRIAETGQPGQFVHIQCADGSDPLLRRPFSFADIDRKAGTYDILFNVVGQGTAILAAAEAGQAFDALGPLGRPFSLPDRGTLLMVAGGLGVAPFPLVARAAREKGLKMRWLNGAYTAHQLLPLELLPDGVEAHQCTDDGSAGEQGFVTALTERLVDGVATVHACGPTPMLIALARQWQHLDDTGRKLPRCEVSVEAPMGCALGTCLGCVVPAAAGGYDRVCVEGAVFEWRALDWSRYAAMGELITHRSPGVRLAAGEMVGR